MKNRARAHIALPGDLELSGLGESPLEGGAGGGHGDGMEARVAVLEQIAKSTAEALMDIKADLRSMRDKHDSDFRITFAAGTAAVLGVVALMAKGFRWF
jgi:hypothetical protein